MDHRLADNIPPPPPFAPVRGHPTMDQRPHDFAAQPHIIEPPRHRNSIPGSGYGDDRSNSIDSGSEPAVLEGYTIARQTIDKQPTYLIAKKSRWIAKEDELKELVKKQQKRGRSPYIPVNGTAEIKSNRRAQVDRLVQDRNNDYLKDPGTQYELAALKTEQFQIKGGADERLKVVLRRRVRRGALRDPRIPIDTATRFSSNEIVDLTHSDDHERSSQSSYPSPPILVPGQDPFSLPVHPQPVHHGGHSDPRIFDQRIPQQPFGSPIGEEVPHPAHRDRVEPEQQPDGFRGFGGMGNHSPRPERVVPEQQPDGFRGFGGMDSHQYHRERVAHDPRPDHSRGHGGEGNHRNDNLENKKDGGEKSKGKQKQQQDESDSSSASDIEIWSVNSDGTPLSAISSNRSSYRGDKRPLRGSSQRQSRSNDHDDRDRNSREEKGYKRESHRFASGCHEDGSRGRDSKDKTYHHDGHKAGSSDHDRGNRGGGSRKDKTYYPESYHRRSVSVDRDDRGRDDKKEKKKYHHESRRNSHSRERSERRYKVEKTYRPESHSSTSDRHRHEHRQTATREHVRKVPDVRSRGSLTDGSTSYTDEEYIIIPQRSSRRVQAAPRGLYEETPLRPRRVLIDDEEPRDYIPRPLGRSNTTAYRPKLANKPFRPVDLHDSRFDYAQEQAELQRQRVLDMQREEEDRIVAQQVQEYLAMEDEEMRLQHQRRTEMAREESRRRIAIKVREELHKARLGRSQPFDEYDFPLRAPRGPAAYDY